jgi:hypothetical protein
MIEGPIYVLLAIAPDAPTKFAKIRLAQLPGTYLLTLEVSDEGTPEVWTPVAELIPAKP